MQQTNLPPILTRLSDGSHVIDYKLHGSEIQYIEITLDPTETVIAEPGALLYMEDGITMQTRFSDGSNEHVGFWGKFFGAVKRNLAKERMFMTFFTNNSNQRLKVAFGSPFPGTIVPIDLGAMGGSIFCHKDGFLAAAKGTAIGMGFTKRIAVGMFGGEGFILQKLSGKGLAFILAGGTISERTLAPEEVIYVETSCLLAFQPSVNFDVKMVKGIKNLAFGGSGLFLSVLTGPGKIWIQSLPITKLMTGINKVLKELNKKSSGAEKKEMASQMHKISKSYQNKG